MNRMPTIDLSTLNLTQEDYAIASQIISTKGKNKGCLRASKPDNGDAAYVWRMVAFQISPLSHHHCLPVMADFGIEVPSSISSREKYEWRNNRAKELRYLTDKIVESIPKEQWHGVRRWHHAFYG